MITIQNLSEVSHRCRWAPKEPVIKAGGSVQIEYADFTRWLTQRSRVAALMRIDIDKGVFRVVIDNGRSGHPIGQGVPRAKQMDSSGRVHPSYKAPTLRDLGLTATAGGIGLPPLVSGKEACSVSDMALILCHYGQDPLRVAAGKAALARIMKSDPMPPAYLVEAAEPGQPRHFEDITGITYIPRVVPDKGRGCWMKECLWTIGARVAAVDHPKLVFLDIDCSFERTDWAVRVSKALNTCDVISPHRFAVYTNQSGEKGVTPLTTRGYTICKGLGPLSGHPGMALGLRTEFFRTALDATIQNTPDGIGDTNFWLQITGSPVSQEIGTFPSRDYSSVDKKGIRPVPRIGYAENTLFHHYHGPFSRRHYRTRKLISRLCFPTVDSGYDYNEDGMPEWPDTPQGRIARGAFGELLAGTDDITPVQLRDLYDRHALKEYGPIDEDNPLVITCLLRSGGAYDGRHVRLLKKQFEQFCRAPFRFVCQTDIEIAGVETIPLITTRAEAPFQWGQIEHYRNIWGKASVLTCDLDTVVCRAFTPHRCPQDEIFMSREYNNWRAGVWTIWNCGLVYFRGNFECLFESYMRDVRYGREHRPDRTLIGSQENLVAYLREHGRYVKNIDAHFCQKFYVPDHPFQTEAHIVSFPDRPKSWDLHPAPSWFPAGYELN